MSLRLSVLGAAVAVFLALGWYAAHEHKRAASEGKRRVAAEAAEKLAKETTRVVEKYHTQTRIITQRAEASADAIETIPSGELPDDIRGPWLDGVREASASLDPDRSAKPSGALPSTGP